MSLSIEGSSALLSERDAAIHLNISVRTLQAWRVRGGGPVFVKMGRSVRYQLDDLAKWIEVNRVHHTSEAGQ